METRAQRLRSFFLRRDVAGTAATTTLATGKFVYELNETPDDMDGGDLVRFILGNEDFQWGAGGVLLLFLAWFIFREYQRSHVPDKARPPQRRDATQRRERSDFSPALKA